jgi:hypothetical protein
METDSLLKHWHLDNPDNVRTIIEAAKKNRESPRQHLFALTCPHFLYQTKLEFSAKS